MQYMMLCSLFWPGSSRVGTGHGPDSIILSYFLDCWELFPVCREMCTDFKQLFLNSRELFLVSKELFLD